MILNDYREFIDRVYGKLISLNIDTQEITIDHIGYQADSAEDYDYQIKHIEDFATQVSENIVGDRRVGIFKLKSSLQYLNQNFSVIEIFEPRKDQSVKSSWEHVEFLVDKSLEEFINEYPKVDWDSSVINREEFPMLILSLGEGMRAKFPRRSVLVEINNINN